MRFPVIRVRDKLTGREHVVGSDTHDTLYVGDDGGIHYYNLQNGEGTGRNGDYEFVGVDDEYALGPEIEFVRVKSDNSGIIAEIKGLLENWDFRAIASELESGYDQGVVVELVELCEELTGAKSPRVNAPEGDGNDV